VVVLLFFTRFGMGLRAAECGRCYSVPPACAPSSIADRRRARTSVVA
jgi:hypothetical protein